MPAPLPEALRPWGWLIGHWVGVGTVQYPTIEDGNFGQEMVFATDGRPFLTYHSRSWLLDSDGATVRPLATESGYWRPRPDNEVEVTLAHPTGYAEIWLGHLEVTGLQDAEVTGARVTMRSDVVARTSSSKDYTGGERLYGLVDGRLLWTFDMAAVGQALGNHLAATLYRQGDSPAPSGEEESSP